MHQDTRLCAAPATEITLDYGAEPLTQAPGAFVAGAIVAGTFVFAGNVGRA